MNENVLYFVVAAAAVIFVAALLMRPKRRRRGMAMSRSFAPEPIGFRRGQLDEEAALVADEYRAAADRLWRAEVRGKASGMFAEEPR